MRLVLKKRRLWHPGRYPEMIVKDFDQLTLPKGPVSSWQSTGIKPEEATQSDPALRPTKIEKGVKFEKGTKQSLSWPVDTDAPWLHRWWLAITRCDLAGNPSGNAPIICMINGASSGGAYRQPAMMYALGTNLLSSQVHDGTGFKSESGSPSTNPDVWNVIIGWTRGGIHRASINGTWTAGTAHRPWVKNNANSRSLMGSDTSNNSGADLWIDKLILGQGILTDDFIRKLEGWAAWRAGPETVALLPSNHPYKTASVELEADDLPDFYEFDQSAWDTWAAIPAATRFATRGEAAPTITGYSKVFEDHFLSQTVADDVSGSVRANWYAPGWNTAVGVNATLARVADSPSVYVHDGDSALNLRLLYSSGWKAGAFYSINLRGEGRRWGKGLFEIRCKFPNLPEAGRPGFFPAFWAYGGEHLEWRTRNRIEPDFLEYDGKNGAWFNNTLHVHIPVLDPPDATNIRVGSDMMDKPAGYEVSPTVDADFPAKIDIYDGQYHVWQFLIDDDNYTAILDGRQLFTVPSTPELRALKYLIVDFAYSTPSHGAVADQGQTYDMTIDYIRVYQKDTDLAVVPAAFTGRPTIAGTTTQGQTLTVTPRVTASQIEYWWYRDGVPLPDTGNTHVLDAADVGHKIRCMVRAMSLQDQPFAWTAETATIT